MSEQDRPPPTKHAFDRGVVSGRDAERAAVVAWLRSEAEAAAQTYTDQAWVWASRVDNMADSVEKGEHRKEEP